MKTNQKLAWTAALLAGLAAMSIRAEESAVVKDNRVNVRGQASLRGEVVTQVRQGETVVVLEEISVAKPKPGEPAKWLRIQMPTNTPVWVSAALIDPTNKTVTVKRLNVRAGPGENFSVVARLEKDTVVKEIRTVENWMEIETPTNAYGFVAAELLTRFEPPVAPVAVEKPQPQTPPPANPPPVVATTVTPPPAKPEPVVPPVEQPPAVTLPVVAAPTPPPKEEPPPKRIVAREGFVRRTASIQAPTYFELQSRETGKIINYLHTEKIDLKLDAWTGRKILVTGEESIDERWPNVPVIEVETLRLVP